MKFLNKYSTKQKAVSIQNIKHIIVSASKGGLYMKIDERTINTVLKFNDDKLWQTIQYAVAKSGTDALKDMKRPADMTKIRSALSSLTNEDIARVTEILKGKGGK